MKDRSAAIVLGQLLLRIPLFSASHDKARAEQRLTTFLSRSAAYAAARGHPAAGDVTSHHGLTWRIPPTPADDSFANRIRRGWLPVGHILASRRVVCGGVMLDIGANIGTTSITRVILGDFEAVYAAEPEPANYAALVENIAVNGVEGSVLPDRIAIGAEDGSAEFVLRKGIGRHGLAEAAPPLPTNKLAKSLAYFREMPESYTDLILFNCAD